MISALALYFRKRRIEQTLSVGKLARLAGYRNLAKGSKRIHQFERTGSVDSHLLATLSSVLEVADATMQRLMEEDRRTFLEEWAAWQAQSITPYVVIHLMPAWYSGVTVPRSATSMIAAEKFAASIAIAARREVCLVWSRRVSVHLDATGSVIAYIEALPGTEHSPWLRIGGKYFLPGVGRLRWPQHLLRRMNN